MYGTVRTYSASSDLLDGLVRNEGEVRKLVSEIDGFKAYYLIRTDEGGAVSLTVYEDETGAYESNKLAAAWIGENLPEVTGSAPQVSAGEVVISA